MREAGSLRFASFMPSVSITLPLRAVLCICTIERVLIVQRQPVGVFMRAAAAVLRMCILVVLLATVP